jgi:hypothetical protein
MKALFNSDANYDCVISQEERDSLVVNIAKDLDEKTKLLADAVKARDENAQEVEKLRVCVEGWSAFAVFQSGGGLILCVQVA